MQSQVFVLAEQCKAMEQLNMHRYHEGMQGEITSQMQSDKEAMIHLGVEVMARWTWVGWKGLAFFTVLLPTIVPLSTLNVASGAYVTSATQYSSTQQR